MRRLTPRGGWIRFLVTIAVLLLMGAGAVRGDQDHFPFAPFSQYSGSPKTSGTFTVLTLEGLTEDGAEIPLRFSKLGLRRAEMERQLGDLGRSPDEVIPHLAAAYQKLNPHGPTLSELRLVSIIVTLKDSVPANQREVRLATWPL